MFHLAPHNLHHAHFLLFKSTFVVNGIPNFTCHTRRTWHFWRLEISPSPAVGSLHEGLNASFEGRNPPSFHRRSVCLCFCLPFASCVSLWCVHLKTCKYTYIYTYASLTLMTEKLKTSLSYSDLCLEGGPASRSRDCMAQNDWVHPPQVVGATNPKLIEAA